MKYLIFILLIPTVVWADHQDCITWTTAQLELLAERQGWQPDLRDSRGRLTNQTKVEFAEDYLDRVYESLRNAVEEKDANERNENALNSQRQAAQTRHQGLANQRTRQ